MKSGRILVSIVVLLLMAGTIYARQNVRLHGTVRDSRTNELIAKALVSIRDLKIQATTDESGEFEIADVPPGEVELYVTTVGYTVIRRKIAVQAGTPVEIEIFLGPDVLRRSDEVTVTAAPFVTPEASTISDHTLTESELKNLTSVLVDDPLRSVQALPGVTTGDDFVADFSVRGAGFRSIGFNMDGVLLVSPLHSVSDITDGGSISIFNGDVIESVTLLGSGFPATYGDRTASELVVRTRDGNRQRFANSAMASASGLGWTSEGPLGKSRKASWIGSARKSYLDYILNQISSDTTSTQFVFGFYDGFGKLTLDPNDHHQIRISGNFANSRADQHKRLATLGINSFLYGDLHNRIAQGDWRWIPSSKIVLDSSISYSTTYANNVNRDRNLLFDSSFQQVGTKQDVSFQALPGNRIEAGYYARDLDQNGTRRRFNFTTAQFRTSDAFDGSAWQPGAYVQDNVTTLGSRISLTYGLRYDRFSATGQTIWMPRVNVAVSPLRNTRVTLGYGQYSQFPDLFQLYGEFSNPALRAERATHYVLGVEQLLTDKTRIRVEAYDREDRNGIYSASDEIRLFNGVVAGPRAGVRSGSPLQNTLRGYSKGVEVFLQRRSANRLLGWISYAYGRTSVRDAATGLLWDGDFDQRHTFSVYASYRWTDSLNLSMKYRYGTNFPIAGFFARDVNGRVILSDQRNLLRMPIYSRLDLRVNKAFRFDRWQLTLYGEVLNVLAHDNRRWTTNLDTTNGGVSVNQDSLFPFLPLAGIRIDF
ncbi:MAG TPA: TonB-dependent receptor [Terriglobia bacterium]|nr:TonB-dependent receptor [Terriglobia bacterium]